MIKAYLGSFCSFTRKDNNANVMFGPKIILAENRHEAVGKLLEMVQKEYPPSEGWTTEIVVGEISWAELQMYANAVKVNND